MIRKIKSTSSIRRKVFFPVSFLIVAIMVIFNLSLGVFGFFSMLNDSAKKALYYPVKNRADDLSSQMRYMALKANETGKIINESFSSHFKEAINSNSKDGTALIEENLRNVLPILLETTKRIDISGVFVLVNTSIYEDNIHRSGIRIKDNQPGVIIESNADLQYSRGPSYLLSDNKLPMDSFWSYEFNVDKESTLNKGFYWEPMLACNSFYYRLQEERGYWSKPYKPSELEGEIVSYSIPLLDEGGKAYGVFGIDFSVDYLARMIPAKEISYKDSFYLIGSFDKGSKTLDMKSVIKSGNSASRFVSSFQENIRVYTTSESEEYDIFSVNTKDKQYNKLYAKSEKINLYDSNSFFSYEDWYLIGFAPNAEVVSYYKSMLYSLLLSLVATVILGVVILRFISSKFTRPIIDMSVSVKNHDFNKPISIEKIGIAEIDNLALALENATSEVLSSSARFSLTVDLVGAEVGSFEYDFEAERVFLTDSLFKLLDIEKIKGNNYIPSSLWGQITKDTFDISEFEYISPKSKRVRWLRMKSASVNNKVLGILVDITREVHERKRIELERDLDMLTGLYNRRAFQALVKSKLTSPEAKIGALIFLDLDNLKYINDVYGHDVGDKYLKAAADNLRKFNSRDAILSRISGDEFAIYIDGDKNREALMCEIQEIIDSFDSVLRLPDNSAQKVRASIGIAFYPEDADNFSELIKYADFAMYEIKHSFKGRIKEFDKSSYDKNYYLLNKKEALNNLIENKLVYFVFQPIVNAQDGKIMAFEALMRSKSEDFDTPFEILTLAKSQAKLYEIEKLTIFGVLQQYKIVRERLAGKKIFINSIPNQSISEEDIKQIETEYKDYLSAFVIELTEEEKIKKKNEEPMLNLFIENGGEIAIDDFGAGYSNEIALITVVPNYVKIDMSLVRDINRNHHKQKLVSNIISYAKENSIKTIAEGVENYDEMRTLILLGTDYLQGFYISRPSEEINDIPDIIEKEIISIRHIQKNN